ncbi:4a-hydroxytetrahydrobiopterin dehydratase [Nocardioides donggukensis]|uniref:Putative pterin-4-alpha-carbinolamine dehydratase n=1 Tax=Nocardioides donggukensis TaxID=2774019 RepID=A0A927PYU4_9ACTN|nr:4a-hydroxytetrahydrobiopterin dehydratase [Nocardioides donggukensis]MBD8868963.1 4a-hydroxytetrahydrobiopterin dehydratase [Nocardioides donggukensis]
MDTEALTARQILDADLADWRQLVGAIQARYATGDFGTGLELVNRIGAAAEESNHHPDLDLRYGSLDVRLLSHDVHGLTRRDVDLARRITALAAEVGARPEPLSVSRVELALDATDPAALKPFWRAVLGLLDHPGADDELIDPDGRLPTLWFQATTAHEEPRQRFHVAVHVAHDVAEQRVAEALAAGGRMVSDAEAPLFWVLADAEGNQACVCTQLDRG